MVYGARACRRRPTVSSQTWKKKLCFAVRDGWSIFVSCFVHTSGQLFFIIRLVTLPPHDAGHGVKKMAVGWVGAPNERTPFKIHDAVVGFVERCQSRTRNLAASNQSSAWVLLKPILAQHRPQICFFRAFPTVWNLFFFLTCPYEACSSDSLAGIFEIQPFC